MKKTAIIILMMMSISAIAQKGEFGIQLNSGLFSFLGDGTRKDAYVTYDARGNMGIGDHNSTGGVSFGGRNGQNIGAGVNIKWVTSFNLFFASELGFDYSQCRTAIYKMYWNGEEAAKGKANLRFATIYIAPTIGYRIQIKKTNVDLGIGLDISRLVSSSERMSAQSKESVKELSYVRTQSFHLEKGYQYDLRKHANIKITYKRYGVFCGYSAGTTNYKKGLVGGSLKHATSRLWRMGISYQLK